MPRHANFAAAIALREATLQDFVRILHRADQITHTLAADNDVPMPGGQGHLGANLFLEAPRIVCAAANNDRLALELRGWGPMSFRVPTPGGPVEAARQVLFQARVVATPNLTLASSQLTIAVGAWTATLASLQIDVLVGGAWPPAIATFLASQQFRDLVEIAIRLQLAAMTSLAPPVSVSFLGDIASSTNTTVTTRVLDGVLVIGLDVNESGIATTGDRNQLTDFREGNDLAMWTNPVAAPVAFAMVRRSVQTVVDQQSATLDSFTTTIQEGSLHVSGHATKSPGGVSFSMNAVPHLVRPGWTEEWDEEYGEHFVIEHPAREELWFEMRDVVVDIERDWWVYVLEALGAVLTIGIAIPIVESLVGMVRGNILGGISGNNSSIAPRVQEFTLAGTTAPLVRLRIERFEFHGEGAFAGMTLRPQYPAAELTGPTSIPVEALPLAPLRWQVRLPFDAHPADPNLRIRWTLRRLDTNAIIFSDEGQAGPRLALQTSLSDPSYMTAPRFLVECRVFRTLGSSTQDLFNQSLELRIYDRLDRTHPYVRWTHSVYTPRVRVESDGSHTQDGYDLKERHSAIHRTAVPGRCRMVSRFSAKVAPSPELAPTYAPVLDYLDALPFPVAQLVAHRSQVCDYCFFGGPDKNDPLI